MSSANETYHWVAELCHFSPRIPGTRNMDRATEYIMKKLQEFNLEVWTEPINFRGVFYRDWQFKILSPDEKIVISFPQVYVGHGRVETELLDVGKGLEEDYQGKDVKDKIVLVDWGSWFKDQESACALGLRYPQLVTYDVAWRHGAAALVGYVTDSPGNSLRILEPGINPDGGSNTRGPCEVGPDRRILLPALIIGKKDAEHLKDLLRKSRVKARVFIDGTRKISTIRNIMARLPGKTDDVIFLASHYDGAFVDALITAGAAGAIAIAKHFSQIELKYRPKTMVFMFESAHEWINCNIPGLIFIKNHSELVPKISACVWLDFITDKTVSRWLSAPRSLEPIVSDTLKRNGRKVISFRGEHSEEYTSCTMGVLNRQAIPAISCSATAVELLHTTEDTLDKMSPSQLQKDVNVFIELVEKLQHISVMRLKPEEIPKLGCGVLFTESDTPDYPNGESYVPEVAPPLYVGGKDRSVRIL
ncbi:MAG: M28 family peptidase, partial [Candidatus Bathyarchaeia archaeon]